MMCTGKCKTLKTIFRFTWLVDWYDYSFEIHTDIGFVGIASQCKLQNNLTDKWDKNFIYLVHIYVI